MKQLTKTISLLLTVLLVFGSFSGVTAVSASEFPIAENDTVYTVAGSSEVIFGSVFDPADKNNILTDNGDGTYSKTFYDVQPTEDYVMAAVGYNFKALEQFGQRYDMREFKVVSPCDVTMTFIKSRQLLSITGDGVELPFSIESVHTVFDWSGDVFAENSSMTKIKDDGFGLWSITLDSCKAGNYTFDFVANEDQTMSLRTAEDTVFENGKNQNAAFDNGTVIPYHVNQDNATVIITLDLTKFNASTLDGAAYNITVSETKKLFGDVDMDGRIIISDATTIQKIVAGMISLKDDDKAIADVNGDNSVTISDATCIQYYLAGQKEKACKTGQAF